MTCTYSCTARSYALAVTVWLLLAWAGLARATSADDAVRLDLPAQPLEAALVTFGELTGYAVLISSDLAAGRSSASVHGAYTPAEALQRMLIGTGLDVRFSGSRAFTLQPLARNTTTPAASEQAPPALPLPPYSAVLQRAITAALCRLHPHDFGRYRLGVQLWLDAGGRVASVHMLESSGSAPRDQAVLARLRSLSMDAMPPPDLAQPLTILLTPRPDPGAACRPRPAGGR